MGAYINPQNGQSKEQWLEESGKEFQTAPPYSENPRVVALIDNGPFRAAGIAYEKREYDQMIRIQDRHNRRPHQSLDRSQSPVHGEARR